MRISPHLYIIHKPNRCKNIIIWSYSLLEYSFYERQFYSYSSNYFDGYFYFYLSHYYYKVTTLKLSTAFAYATHLWSQIFAALTTQLHTYHRVWMWVLECRSLLVAMINELRLAKLRWGSMLTCSGENELGIHLKILLGSKPPPSFKCISNIYPRFVSGPSFLWLCLWSCSFSEGCQGFLSPVESNVISAAPVHLYDFMAATHCLPANLFQIWQPGVSKWYWRYGQWAGSHRQKTQTDVPPRNGNFYGEHRPADYCTVVQRDHF